MARRQRYLVGLDVGTSKVAAIVGEVMDEGNLDIIGSPKPKESAGVS
jgi:cell division ATPase FtsA